jgi:hypothetical protein
MAPTTTPVSAAAEQQHDNNDNKNQFHWESPLIITQRGNRPSGTKFRSARTKDK